MNDDPMAVRDILIKNTFTPSLPKYVKLIYKSLLANGIGRSVSQMVAILNHVGGHYFNLFKCRYTREKPHWLVIPVLIQLNC